MSKETKKEQFSASKPESDGKLLGQDEYPQQKELEQPSREKEKLLSGETQGKQQSGADKQKLLSGSDGNKLAEYEDTLKRLQAEFDNFRKRIEKEKIERARFEGEGLAAKLLPFIDDMDAAVDSAEKSKDAKLKDSVSLLRAKLLAILLKDGVSEMKCEGEMFDPYKHEAVLHEQSDKKDGTVIRVIRKGYVFNGKILRHAMVSVSDGKKESK